MPSARRRPPGDTTLLIIVFAAFCYDLARALGYRVWPRRCPACQAPLRRAHRCDFTGDQMTARR